MNTSTTASGNDPVAVLLPLPPKKKKKELAKDASSGKNKPEIGKTKKEKTKERSRDSVMARRLSVLPVALQQPPSRQVKSPACDMLPKKSGAPPSAT